MFANKACLIVKLAVFVVMGMLYLPAVPVQSQDLLSLARQVTGGSTYRVADLRAAYRQANQASQAGVMQDAAFPVTDLNGQVFATPQAFQDQHWAGLDSTKATLLNTRSQSRNGEAIDPSNPFQAIFHIGYEWQWQSLSQDQGELYGFNINPVIPFKLAGHQLLANLKVPLPGQADLPGLGGFSGIGDTRLQLSWLVPSDRKRIRTFVPALDAIAPTGDVRRGLGGGQWVLIPNLGMAIQPLKNLTIYPYLRYVHADDLTAGLVPEIPGLPTIPGDRFGRVDVRGVNLELPFVFQLQDAFIDWIGIAPDYFQNLTGERQGTLTMKYDWGIQLNRQLFLMGDVWHPVSTTTNSDFTFRLTLDWYPQIGQCRSCGGRNGIRRRCGCR